MTDTVTMNPEDRALWDRYVRSRRGASEGADAIGTVSGSDAGLIAAYLALRLDEWERAAFEGRLVNEPVLLDTLIAARALMDAPAQTAPPQAVTAFALNMAPAPATVRTAAPPMLPARRRWFIPGFAWALSTAAFLGAFAVGAIVAWQVMDPPQMAQKAKDPLADELRPRNNSIFEDPARTIFDGMDVEE